MCGTLTAKPDHYLETEHLQMLIDSPQNGNLWGILGAAYGFRNGTVDDRTGEIFCPARDEEPLVTFKSNGRRSRKHD
jgi:hypothetical protein